MYRLKKLRKFQKQEEKYKVASPGNQANLDKYYQDFQAIIDKYPYCGKVAPVIHQVVSSLKYKWFEWCTSYLEQGKSKCKRIIFLIHPGHQLVIFHSIISDHDYSKIAKLSHQHGKKLIDSILREEWL